MSAAVRVVVINPLTRCRRTFVFKNRRYRKHIPILKQEYPEFRFYLVHCGQATPPPEGFVPPFRYGVARKGITDWWCPYCRKARKFRRSRELKVRRCGICGISDRDFYVRIYNAVPEPRKQVKKRKDKNVLHVDPIKVKKAMRAERRKRRKKSNG